MITEDYLVRQIEIITRTLAKLLFNKESPEYEIKAENRQTPTETDITCNHLRDLIDQRNIDAAENLLFEKIETELENDPEGQKYLEVALDFYFKLNELSTRELDDCNFERDEIDEGLREVAEMYGINVI